MAASFVTTSARHTLARTGAALALLAAVLVCVVVLRATLQRPSLHPGDPLPPVDIQVADSSRITLSPADSGVVMIMLSDDECNYCHAQLDTFEAAIADFRTVRLYVVTFARDVARSSRTGQGPARWPRLRNAPHVAWGTVDQDAWMASFGTALTPTVFVFRAGTLVSAFRGETGRSALLRATGTGPETR